MKKLSKFAILLATIPFLILISKEIIYFTGLFESASAANNKAPVRFYIINLDRQPEKYNKFKANADRFALNVERISAVDGYKIIFVDHNTNEVMTGAEIKAGTKSFAEQHKYDVYCTQESYETQSPPEFVYDVMANLHRVLTPGEIGLTCTSRLIWKQIISSPEDQTAVIFEDDAVLLDNFEKHFSMFLNSLPESWDLAYLDADVYPIFSVMKPSTWRWKLRLPQLTIKDQLIKIHPEINVERTHGYLINRASAKKLLDLSKVDNSVPLDVLFTDAIRHNGIIAYIAKDKIISYDDSLQSEISAMGRDRFGN